jgi:acetyl-CoA carboxylase carboxyltransferase component
MARVTLPGKSTSDMRGTACAKTLREEDFGRERMTWQPELDELRERERMAYQMGGPDKVKRQHDAGRLTIRERITELVDPGSFHEVGAIAGKASYDGDNKLVDLLPSNCVMGRAQIDGRPVVVCGDDFTVRGGSADATIKEKPLMAEQMAEALHLPIVRFIEGSGGGGSVKTIEITGRANLPGGISAGTEAFHFTTNNMSIVPVVGLGLGSVAGLGAARLVASHYSVMTKPTSAMFVAGPPLVARTGQHLSKMELGGWEIQTKAGGIDHAVDTEEEAFECARRFLSYLPSSVYDVAPRGPRTDDPERREESLFTVIPRDTRKVYRMRPIIDAVVDKGSFFEMGRMFGRSIITGLARIDGLPVAVMASDPYFYAGAWTADTCNKVIRFVDLAETFHIPVVYLVDCPGFLIGLDAEKSAVIRVGTRAMAAVNQTTVPWCTVIVRSSFGVAGAVHQPAGRFAVRYAWISARWGSLPLEGGIEAAYRQDIADAPDPVAKQKEIETRLNKLRSPLRTAEAFWVEELIDPRDTRKLLVEFARLAEPLRKPGPTGFGMRP